MSKKKEIIVIILIITVALVGIIGTTLAVFSTGNKQTGLNSFSSGCLNITIEDESAALSLSKSYPITDIEGIESNPYTFTIRNTCSTPTNYQINLESINEKSNTLSGDYVKVSLSSDTMDNVISTLISNTAITPSLDNAYAAYNLYTGVLEGNSSKTYNLKEWIEYNATIEQAANKVYESRISVIANPDLIVTDKADLKFNINEGTVTGTITGNANTVKYCITENGICTPSTDTTITNKTITIEVEDRSSDKIVCANLDSGKVVCSNKIKAFTAQELILFGRTKAERGEITGPLTSNGNTVYYEAEDDAGVSQYLAGDVTNNWVQFAGFYWRIIRINGDGTIRMIYNGISTTTTGTGTQIGTKAFNSNDNDNAYVGLMFGTAGSSTYAATHANNNPSTILGTTSDTTTLLGWYKANIVDKGYSNKVSTDAGFCNDRSIASSSQTWWSSDTKKGYGTNATAYGPWSRILKTDGNYNSTQTPKFGCSQSADLFTASNSAKGNKKLTYPVGLITADEVIYAGGFGGTANSSYYLYTNKYYWTMSPRRMNTSGYAYVFIVDSSGFLANYRVNSTAPGVRPVINLASDVKLSGSGTIDSPFQVVS